jgi:hypothetical protein
MEILSLDSTRLGCAQPVTPGPARAPGLSRLRPRRAFFYAGTRLLVTGGLFSQRRATATDLFRRKHRCELCPGERCASRRTLLDGKGSLTLPGPGVLHAHPLFWAPYTIIGDGG